MRTLRRSEQVLHFLGKRIVNGELLPGVTLPKVEVFSETHGVSRTVVREALKGLEARGLVASVPKVGTKVRERSAWQWWNREVIMWAMDTPDAREYLAWLQCGKEAFREK